MATRDRAPIGAPCWADLWTSDVEGSRSFYSEMFGWEAQAPSPEFGGYFMFTRDGVPMAGAMGDMGEMRASDSWKIYLASEDIAKTLEVATGMGAEIAVPAMEVADLGTQLVLTDPTGATVGAWQAGTFPGFTVLNENGSPSWFELNTRDYAAAISFYRATFSWETEAISDTDEFRYSTARDPGGDEELAGIMDAAAFLPPAVPSHWSIYWQVDDGDAAVAKVKALGGSIVTAPVDTPYGRLATVTDPAGAEFKLRTPSS